MAYILRGLSAEPFRPLFAMGGNALAAAVTATAPTAASASPSNANSARNGSALSPRMVYVTIFSCIEESLLPVPRGLRVPAIAFKAGLRKPALNQPFSNLASLQGACYGARDLSRGRLRARLFSSGRTMGSAPPSREAPRRPMICIRE